MAVREPAEERVWEEILRTSRDRLRVSEILIRDILDCVSQTEQAIQASERLLDSTEVLRQVQGCLIREREETP